MKKIGNLFKEKVPALITIDVTVISVQTEQPGSMSLCWKRGPQRDESEKFEVIPSQTEYEVSNTFSRCSKILREKSGTLNTKTCTLELVMVNEDQQQTVGTIDIDLTEMFQKEKETKTLQFTNLQIIQSASVTASFSVSELTKEEAKEAMAGQITGTKNNMNKLKRRLTVAKAADFAQSDAFAKIAEKTGNEELIKASEMAQSDQFGKAMEIAQSDDFANAADAIKKGDVDMFTDVVAQNEEFKNATDALKEQGMDKLNELKQDEMNKVIGAITESD